MSAPQILRADRLVTGEADLWDGWIEIDEGYVVATGQGAHDSGRVTRVDGTIIPGLVDIHAHGALGFDFGRADADGIRAAAQHHAANGTTTIVASVASGPLDSTRAALERLAPLVDDGTLGGIHLEGPYLSTQHRGAHNPAYLRLPELTELVELVAAAQGALSAVTIAPELEGAESAIRMLAAAGIVVALGHTNCTTEVARAAIDWGVSHVTHLYNGMPEFRHRDPGPVGVALSDDRVTVELIVDGVHIADETAIVAFLAAPDRVALVSDASEATGQPDGDYEIAGSRVRVAAGVARLADGSSLAGSTRVLSDGLHRALALGRVSVLDVVRATSTIPARALRLGTGALVADSPADLVVINSTSRRVSRVMRRGLWLE